MKFEKELIKKDILFPIYNKLIRVENLSEEELEISLPIFLNTGDSVDIYLKKENNNYILSNLLYRSLEDALQEELSSETLIKNYIFGTSKTITNLKKELENNNIDTSSLTNKKLFSSSTNLELSEEIFKYVFLTVRYYNFIYDYILSNLKSKEQQNIFFKEIERFVTNYNKNNKNNFIIIRKENLLSNSNAYYEYNEKILTGASGKVQFLEAMQDIEILKKENNHIKKIIIVYDKFKKNSLNETYIKKAFKTKNIKDSDYKIELLKG